MLYFSYGSNMSHRRLSSRIGNIQKIGVYRLDQHDLRFHKISKDGSAKCDAYFTGRDEDYILGVLHEISENEKPILDKYEGLGKGYEKKDVVVHTDDHSKTAFTYYATITGSELLPYTWYLRHVLEGAREAGFSAEYISKLEDIQCIDDPNSEREAQELSIYE
ncbi:MAG: gamma-glutamylcyclotransferase [Rhodospirillaceae bacterium]|jgi:gamma-glutamylcyclotransferase|nr:gamma-glutamylcyclotransferase [Rhodospirillaceae bacterium]MBT4463912.1 gamma-glutamylcyclotransferase [Rhodospirillaceae bacterium]MBT5014683.1 gamma-glutamylcyclotransferase [Rhodospirillaceae bacterium]MBT5308126.1 gamma-glutamylcyclotransferase [Rhodospirillaceae bacterium]MBT6407658.1 gamma-glutamylcyclotransferase [Rhodospirillaceae bacterium]